MLKKIIVHIILLLCCVPLFFLHIYDLHSWGDDFAQYIKEAQNIANGIPYYKVGYVFNPLNPEYGPHQYPAGFPLLIAPIVKIYGLSLKPLYYFISACLAGLIITLYHFFRHYTRNSITAVCLALICVYSSGVLELKANILSDIPCWLFTAIYMAFRQSDKKGRLRTSAMVISIAMAILIRYQAILILAAEGLFFCYTIIGAYIKTKKISFKEITNNLSFRIILGASLLFILLNFVVFAAPKSGFGYYSELLQYREKSFYDAMENNIYYLYQLFIRLFLYFPWDDGYLKIYASVPSYGIMIFSVLGFIKYAKSEITPITIFYILNILLFITFSQHQGIRFILGIVPIYLLFAFLFFRNIFAQNSRIIGVLFAVVFSTLYFKSGKFDFKLASGNPPKEFIPTQSEQKAFDYIKTNLKDSDLIVFTKPRALSLFTEKRSIVHAHQRSFEDNKKQFDKEEANYMLFTDKIEDEFLRKYLKKYHPDADSVVIAEGYVLYKL